jgi:hypothetical protein
MCENAWKPFQNRGTKDQLELGFKKVDRICGSKTQENQEEILHSVDLKLDCLV